VQPQRLLFQQARDNLLGRRSDVYCDLALRLRPWSEEEELRLLFGMHLSSPEKHSSADSAAAVVTAAQDDDRLPLRVTTL